jgi:hypothetical protein
MQTACRVDSGGNATSTAAQCIAVSGCRWSSDTTNLHCAYASAGLCTPNDLCGAFCSTFSSN